MVMRPEPIHDAVADIAARHRPARRILLTPQGRPFDQAVARALAQTPSFLLFCGRYEGVDERVRPLFDEEISIGDFVLAGGELPALAVLEASVRLIPGVLGCAQSPELESFEGELFDYPQYTRPRVYRDMEVPEILLSGDHQAVERWRAAESRRLTDRIRDPDERADQRAVRSSPPPNDRNETS